MKLGGKIQELRRLSGMTQEQLAQKLDVSRQTISKWETAGSLPDLESVLKLCRLFHISLDDLLEEEKQMQSQTEGITIEDLAHINRHNQRITLLLIGSLLSFLIAAAIAAVVLALDGATSSTQYMLYRYIVVGEYANAPANYQTPYLMAGAAALIGAALAFACIWENRKGRKDA